MKKINKIRVNISVDKELLYKAREKLGLFGGKLSTLFNAYLADFVETMEKDFAAGNKAILERVKQLELKIKKLEEKIQ